MATNNILAGKILWMEKPGGLQSMGSQKVDMTEATEHTYICTYTDKHIRKQTQIEKIYTKKMNNC